MEAVTPRTGLLSVVLPAYNEEESVPLAARTIGGLLVEADIPYELLFVNDGSRDHTWQAIQKAAEQDPRVRGIRFSRNFGKEAAIFAGLAQARGACCVVLDCDLQHPPEKILEMYRLWQEGWQVVEGVKISRGRENPVHTLAARIFYRFLSGATHIDVPGLRLQAAGPPGSGCAHCHAGEKRLLPGPVLLDRL